MESGCSEDEGGYLDVDSPKINPGVSLRVGGSMVDKRSEKSKKIL